MKNVAVIKTLKSKIKIPIGAKTISIASPEKNAMSDISIAGKKGMKKFNLLKSDLYFMYCFAVFFGQITLSKY